MSKNTDIYYFHGREVGLRQVVCHDVVSLVIYYFHGREVGLPTCGMPRCREFSSIYYFHDREVGLPTGGMPRCREFRYILFPRS